MIALILISVAAICKAFSDTIAHHFDTSIFRGKNRDFWEANRVNSAAKRIFGYKVDAWHLSNSLMITCFIAAIFFGGNLHNTIKVSVWVTFVAYGAWFNIVFNIFYNKVFR